MFDGLQRASIGNNGTPSIDYAGLMAARQATGEGGYSPFRGGAPSAYANFDASYEPFNPSNVGGGASAYTVRGGETLQSIAQGLWGDASLWYKIADANGLSGSEPLIEGDSLVIPGKVSSIHQTAKTFRPYDPSRAIGNLSPI